MITYRTGEARKKYAADIAIDDKKLEEHLAAILEWENIANSKGSGRVTAGDLGLGSSVVQNNIGGFRAEVGHGYLWPEALLREVKPAEAIVAADLTEVLINKKWVKGKILDDFHARAIRLLTFDEASTGRHNTIANSQVAGAIELDDIYKKELGAATGISTALDSTGVRIVLNDALSKTQKRKKEKSADESSDDDALSFLKPRLKAVKAEAEDDDVDELPAKKRRGRPGGSSKGAASSTTLPSGSSPKPKTLQKKAKITNMMTAVLKELPATETAIQKASGLFKLAKLAEGLKGQRVAVESVMKDLTLATDACKFALYFSEVAAENGFDGAKILDLAVDAKQKLEVILIFVQASQPRKGEEAPGASKMAEATLRATQAQLPLSANVLSIGIASSLQFAYSTENMPLVLALYDGMLTSGAVQDMLVLGTVPVSCIPEGTARESTQCKLMLNEVCTLIQDSNVDKDASQEIVESRREFAKAGADRLASVQNILDPMMRQTTTALASILVSNDADQTEEELRTSLSFFRDSSCLLYRQAKIFHLLVHSIAEKTELLVKLKSDTTSCGKLAEALNEIATLPQLSTEKPVPIESNLRLASVAHQWHSIFKLLSQMRSTCSNNFFRKNSYATTRLQHALTDITTKVILRAEWSFASCVNAFTDKLKKKQSADDIQTILNVSQPRSDDLGLACIATAESIAVYSELAAERAKVLSHISRAVPALYNDEIDVMSKDIRAALLVVGSFIHKRKDSDINVLEMTALYEVVKQQLIDAVYLALKNKIVEHRLTGVVLQMAKGTPGKSWKLSPVPAVSEQDIPQLVDLCNTIVHEYQPFFELLVDDGDMSVLRFALKSLGVDKGASTWMIDMPWLVCAFRIGRLFQIAKPCEDFSYSEASFIALLNMAPQLTDWKIALAELLSQMSGIGVETVDNVFSMIEYLRARFKFNSCQCELAAIGEMRRSVKTLHAAAKLTVVKAVEDMDVIDDQALEQFRCIGKSPEAKALSVAWLANVKSQHQFDRIKQELKEIDADLAFDLGEQTTLMFDHVKVMYCSMGAVQALSCKLKDSSQRSELCQSAKDQFDEMNVPIQPKLGLWLQKHIGDV